MLMTGKILDNGSIELTMVISSDEQMVIESEELEYDSAIKNDPDKISFETLALRWPRISFKRKTPYCVTCSNTGERHTIWTYGDILAAVKASKICGLGYGLTKGQCQ